MLPITRKSIVCLTAAALFAGSPVFAQDDEEPVATPTTEGDEEAAPPAEELAWTDAPVDEELARLAEQAALGGWMPRREAFEALASQYGGRGVAALLRWIGMNADIDARVQAITALKRLGSDSVPAMIAGLESGDATVRRNLCLTLGEVGAGEAGPALLRIAQHDPDPIARSVAGEALARVAPGIGGSASGALLTAAREYLSGSRVPAMGSDGRLRVYFWNGRRVMDREVKPALWSSANAKLYAESALRLDPSSPDALAALVESYSAMAQVIAGSGDDLGPAGWDQSLPRIQDLLRLGGALVDAPQVDPPTPETLNGATELIESPDKRMRYMAALTLAGTSPTPRVVEVLGDALAESAQRQVLLIADDAVERNMLMAAASALKIVPIAGATGAEGLIRAKEPPVKDAVVIRSTVRDVKYDNIINVLRRDARTSGVPIILVVDEQERERLASELGDKVVAVVPAPVNPAIMKPAFDAAFEKAQLNDERMEAEQFSRRAALALAALDGSVLGPAAGALVGAFDREDPVRIPALVALSKIGAPEGEGPAFMLLHDKSASPDARVAAALALRGILARTPGRPETIHFLAAVTRRGEPAYRSAACSALGAAVGLSPEARAALFLELSLPY